MIGIIGKSAIKLALISSSVSVIALAAAPAMAQQTARSFDIPAQTLSSALAEFSKQSDTLIMTSREQTAGKRSRTLKGSMPVNEALGRLLSGSGLRAVPNPDGGYRIERNAGNGQAARTEATSSLGGDRAGEVEIGEIVVTAQKREQRLLDVPITVAAITGAGIAERGIRNIQDLALNVPELIAFDNGSGGYQLFLRGIGAIGGTEPLVGVYLDEVPVSGQSYLPLDIRPIDLERVEVLHGPQGTLYGQGSAGGTVRFITNKPKLGRFEGSLEADASFTHDGNPSQKLTGVINIPAGETLAVRAAASYQHSGGWVDAPSAGKNNINGGKVFDLRLSAIWRPAESISLEPMILIHRNNIDASGNGEDANGNKALPAFAPTTIPSQEDDFDLYNLTGRIGLGDVDLLSSTTYYRTRSDGSFANAFNGGNSRVFTIRNRHDVFAQEIRLSSSNVAPLKWTIGAFYTDVKYNDLSIGNFGPGAVFSFPAPEKGDSWSIFGNFSYDLSDRLEVGGGARYFSQTKSNNVVKPTFKSFDPRLYLSYSISDNVKTFISAAKGFRSGGFSPFDPGGPTYDPEQVYSYEIGVKFVAPESRLRGEIAAFHSDYRDMQIDFLDPLTFLGFTGNVGKARIQGVDASFQIDLGQALTVGGAGTWLHTKVVDAPPGFGVAPGDRLNYIPKYSISGFAQLKWSWADQVPGSLRIDYSQRGRSVYISRTVSAFDTSGEINMLNARIQGEISNITLAVYASNILNDRNRIIPNIVDFAPRSRPRTFGLSGSYKF